MKIILLFILILSSMVYANTVLESDSLTYSASIYSDERTMKGLVVIASVVLLKLIWNFFKTKPIVERIDGFLVWLKDVKYVKDIVNRILVVGLMIIVCMLLWFITIPVLLWYLYKKYGDVPLNTK